MGLLMLEQDEALRVCVCCLEQHITQGKEELFIYAAPSQASGASWAVQTLPQG